MRCVLYLQVSTDGKSRPDNGTSHEAETEATQEQRRGLMPGTTDLPDADPRGIPRGFLIGTRECDR